MRLPNSRVAFFILLSAVMACHDQGPGTQTGIWVVIQSRPNTGTWLVVDSMPGPRSDFGVAALDGMLYAVGGYYRVDALGSVSAYNPHTDRWISKASLPTPRWGLAVGVVNGTLYAVGGADPINGPMSTVEAYDPATDSWTTMAPMPTARAYLAVGVVDGVLYAVGGTTNPNGAVTASAAVEAYDPATNTWSAKASMTTARGMLAVGVVDGILYAVGGNSQTGEVEAYDPAANAWTARRPMPTKRSGLSVGVIDGVLYAIGGVPTPGETSNFMNTVEAYDPTTDFWKAQSHMPTPRTELGVGVLDSVLYAVGGLAPLSGNSYGFTARNEVFRPAP